MTERHSQVEFKIMFNDNYSVPTVCRTHPSKAGNRDRTTG